MASPNPVPFDEWKPDLSDRVNPTAEAKGVFSVAGQYAPFPDLQDYGPDSTVDEFTTVLLHMDGADATTAFPDDGTAESVWTANGNAQIDTGDSKFGGASLILDGTTDWISTPDDADFTLGSDDWTIDCWFNCNVATGNAKGIAGQGDSAIAAATSAWHISRASGGAMQFGVSDGAAFTTPSGTTVFSNTDNTGWHHLAAVRSGDKLLLFIDGALESQREFTGAVNDSAEDFRVGARGEQTTNTWQGSIDEFRMSVGVARWTHDFQTDNDTYTKILLHFAGADASTVITDVNAGGTPHVWTAAGNAQIDTAISKFGGSAGLFDGTGDIISGTNHADFVLGASDFSVDLWFNCTAPLGATQRLCGHTDATATAAGSAFWIERTDVSGFMFLRLSNGSTFLTITGTTSFTDAVNPGWHHIAVVRTGNVVKMFLDGVQEGGDLAFTGTVPTVATQTFGIGSRGATTTVTPWTGSIDEFRLSVGIARWTANFTPPTAAYATAASFTVPATAFNFGGGAEDVVLGADTFYDDDTAPHIFFGDATRLYTLEVRQAVDVSKAGGYAVGVSDTWQFAQFGNHVVAVSRNVAPQKYTMDLSVDFADLPGTPPTGATSVARVNDFLWMGKDFTVHWSAFNDIDDWVDDPVTQAGSQELDQERGEIMCLVGLDYAAIFQERAIRRAIYVGPPVIWDFGQDYVEKARGAIARNAAVPFGRLIFYVADDGFYAFDGQSSTPIGYGKVDAYFGRNLNYAFRHKVACGIDHSRKLFVVGYPKGSSQFISELLIFSIQEGRWTRDELDLEFLFDTPAEPFTVDNFSTLYPANDLDMEGIIPDDIDSSTFDDRRIRLAAFRTETHQLALFTGATRAATMDTKEFEPAPGKRGLLTEVWPLGDYPEGNVASSVVYRRALPGAAVAVTNPTQMNRAGYCPQRIDARFMRIRQQITAGAVWSRAEGVHFTASPTGGR